MNALTQAIETITATTMQNEVNGSDVFASLGEYFAHCKASQRAELIAPCGAKIELNGVFASGNCHSHCRVSYKVNGKRAKAVDVEALFTTKAPVVATVAMRRSLGTLVGM